MSSGKLNVGASDPFAFLLFFHLLPLRRQGPCGIVSASEMLNRKPGCPYQHRVVQGSVSMNCGMDDEWVDGWKVNLANAADGSILYL